MKWRDDKNIKRIADLNAGKRTISRYCYFPYSVNGNIYWLERISIQQKLSKGFRGDYRWVDNFVV